MIERSIQQRERDGQRDSMISITTWNHLEGGIPDERGVEGEMSRRASLDALEEDSDIDDDEDYDYDQVSYHRSSIDFSRFRILTFVPHHTL